MDLGDCPVDSPTGSHFTPMQNELLLDRAQLHISISSVYSEIIEKPRVVKGISGACWVPPRHAIASKMIFSKYLRKMSLDPAWQTGLAWLELRELKSAGATSALVIILFQRRRFP